LSLMRSLVMQVSIAAAAAAFGAAFGAAIACFRQLLGYIRTDRSHFNGHISVVHSVELQSRPMRIVIIVMTHGVRVSVSIRMSDCPPLTRYEYYWTPLVENGTRECGRVWPCPKKTLGNLWRADL
jgi:hypothetical protein